MVSVASAADGHEAIEAFATQTDKDSIGFFPQADSGSPGLFRPRRVAGTGPVLFVRTCGVGISLAASFSCLALRDILHLQHDDRSCAHRVDARSCLVLVV